MMRSAWMAASLLLLAGSAQASGGGEDEGGQLSEFIWQSVNLALLVGVLVYRNLAFALGGEFLALQHGVVGRYVAYLPTAKVQSVVVRQSPVAQLLGLAELTVHVAGGSPTRLPDLTIGDALQLRGELATIAARAAARDWAPANQANAAAQPAVTATDAAEPGSSAEDPATDQ